MFIYVAALFDAEAVKHLRAWLDHANFVDGRGTAGPEACLVKDNEQVDPADAELAAMQGFVVDTLRANRLFRMAARPKTIRSPLFSRYGPGMAYGSHVDNALMGGMRTDVSVTVFLSDPEEYDGGELVIESSSGEQDVKLPAGSAILYPTASLHRVAPLRSGQRLAAVTWVRSHVRDSAKREILFDLETARHGLVGKLGKGPETDLLAKAQSNLLRAWVED